MAPPVTADRSKVGNREQSLNAAFDPSAPRPSNSGLGGAIFASALIDIAVSRIAATVKATTNPGPGASPTGVLFGCL